MTNHDFTGKWISDERLASRAPRNVFFRQLERETLPRDEEENSHVLFRKKVTLENVTDAKVYITADDCYKLYLNGTFVAQGPAPAYHNCYNYNEIDVTEYLVEAYG